MEEAHFIPTSGSGSEYGASEKDADIAVTPKPTRRFVSLLLLLFPSS